MHSTAWIQTCMYVCSFNTASTHISQHIQIRIYQCFPQKEIATGYQGGPDDSLSSVLLYTHVPYEGKDVRVHRILLFHSITLLAKEFSITMIIQLSLKFAARKATGAAPCSRHTGGNTDNIHTYIHKYIHAHM